MKKSVVLVLVLAVVGAVLLSLSGCSLSTSTADVVFDNYDGVNYTVSLDGSSYSVGALDIVTVSLEWDGLSEKDFTATLYESGIGRGSESMTLSDGDSKTYYIDLY